MSTIYFKNMPKNDGYLFPQWVLAEVGFFTDSVPKPPARITVYKSQITTTPSLKNLL